MWGAPPVPLEVLAPLAVRVSTLAPLNLSPPHPLWERQPCLRLYPSSDHKLQDLLNSCHASVPRFQAKKKAEDAH